MGIEFRRPPLPAPTESLGEDTTSGAETEVATNVTARTDKTSYSIPEDGRPITISTRKTRDGSSGHHSRKKSQTSLLIEYFEASKTGDKSRSKPSVRVKVTPSSGKKSRSGSEAIQITGIGSDRKPSYTRRISLGTGSRSIETGATVGQGTELSHSSGSNVSGHPPVEIEVLNDGSDLSNRRNSRELTYAPAGSNVSSMPPDSMLEGEGYNESEVSQTVDTHRDDMDHLKAPVRTGSKNRSDSRERLTQKVMEKLEQSSSKPRKSSRSDRERSAKDSELDLQSRERRRKSSHPRRSEEDTVSGAETSQLSSRSGASQASRMTNNPKLLEMVEDTIKRMILPEINAIKEDQKSDRKLRSYESSRRASGDGDLERRVSKSSSSPNIASKPKVVLNRNGDDPGVVLSRGDSERVKYRKSSRDSPSEKRPSSSRRSSGQSRRESYEAEEKLRPRSSKSNNGLRGAAAAGLAGGILTSAALRHHDSSGDMHERRKKRSKSRSSRSRSASITELGETYTKSAIPPMPLASNLNDSDTTRASLLSEHTKSSTSADGPPVVREVSRGSIGDGSPTSSRTPTRASFPKSLGMSHSNHSFDNSPRSPRSPNGGISNKARMAALAAAGLGGIAMAKTSDGNHMDADGYGTTTRTTTQRKISSPVQSVSSLKKNFEDEEPLVPHASHPQTTAARSSAGRLRRGNHSQSSLRSAESSPTTKLGPSRERSRNASMDDFVTLAEQSHSPFQNDRASTPGGETADEWFERQHLVNDRYRNSMDAATNRDSYQTNPYPQDEKRFTTLTDDSYGPPIESTFGEDKDVRDIGLSPNFIHTPVAVESAVASLMEPSTVDGYALSSRGSPGKRNASYSDRMAEHIRSQGNDSPALYEGSTLSQSIPSQDRWAAIKGHARHLSGSLENIQLPRHAGTKAVRQDRTIDQQPKMSASGLPVADDPMPEIGHYDSQSDLNTNPSIIQGPLGGDATGKDTWPYTPDPPSEPANRDSQSTGRRTADALMAAAGGGAAALAAAHAYRATAEDEWDERDERREYQSKQTRNGHHEAERNITPGETQATFRDEGYATDGRTRSAGGITPKQDITYGQGDVNEYKRAMDAQDLGADDPFAVNPKHERNFSGNSHGMGSPLYDSSTGKGVDRIQSHDVVALMDHLTVRDAQRNARDTEILVTLVRSAAEMRQSFDEIKKFIAEQDKMIMQNTDRDAEYTAQKVLSGPRPQPLGSPRTPRMPAQSDEDIQTKRKGVLRRALKGLTGGKSAKDLARIEDMLMQILDNVEDLKQQSGGRPGLERSYTEDTLDSYEKLRVGPDSGYEPEGQAGTSSTPGHSGHFTALPREKQQFHSGYDGRRGSDTRVSTVLEDDEDELGPHEQNVLNNQFENNERLLTPTQEAYRSRGLSPNEVSPLHAATFTSPDKQQRHRSSGSTSFIPPIPKTSRWSRTTASSAAPDPAVFDSPERSRGLRPASEASQSGSTLKQYDDEQYSLHEDDRIRSTQSLAKEQDRNAGQADARSVRSHASRMTRTPSPLIPSETSSYHKGDYHDGEYAPSPVQEDEDAMLEDPKYQAHRNSLLLEHPQPRQGPTGRHQNTLESQAQIFDDPTGTNSDLSQRTVSDFDPAGWGSAGTAGLARHRLTQLEPISPVSLNSPGSNRASKLDPSPLVPRPLQQQPQKAPAVPPKIKHDADESEDEELQFSNSGFSKPSNYSYSSPYGSGHLLEPIQEVRYSLETDSGRISPEHIQLVSAKAVDMRSPGRKITGPRPMITGAGNSPGATARLVDHAGTVRRKPVPRQGAFDSDEE
ncbi:hypothetical protein TI39_contig4199g00006 [Zymoseptoria brevis]|uniref:Uncharacterized protein n=1 Tax=Zymoseptoria brevis TaxID=1047168 RepID=A0A0F4GAG2_9PEZI|nr:hypothetical protein TI39_contig4199g00006 [Zymoseptoria brevis]